MGKNLLITQALFSFCLLSGLAQAQVLFEDNFDSQPDWTVTQQIYGGDQCWSDCSIPGEATGYLNSGTNCGSDVSGRPGNNNLYINQYAGYPSETNACRGGGGKCFTHWMESCLQPPQFDDADGMLGYDLGTEYEEVHVRFFIRFKTGFELLSGGMFKLWHAQHWSGSATPWNYFERDTNNQPVSAGGIVNYDGNIFLYHNARCYATYVCYGDILWMLGTSSWANAPGGIFDGNWHSIEMRYKRNSAIGAADGLVETWFDGVKKDYLDGYEGNDIPLTDSGIDLRGFRFMSIGGNNMAWDYGCNNMVDCEQWYSIDDVVISTQYIGPDYVIGNVTCTDSDADGYNMSASGCGPGDCNDSNPLVNPGRAEIPYNGLDDDCNSLTRDNDLDQDSYPTPQDCNDNSQPIHPGATEICGNGIDEDCSGSDLACPVCTDSDADGYFNVAGCGTAVDCDDNDPQVNPGRTELCTNSLDDDCDGAADCSDSSCYGQPSCPSSDCSGLALLMHFDSNYSAGETASLLRDFSKGNNATCSYCPPFTQQGMFSGGLQCNGNGYFNNQDAPELEPAQNVTISAWIRPSALSAAYVAVKGDYTTYGLVSTTSGIRFMINSFENGPSASVSPGQWTHIAGTYDGSAIRIYRNGVEAANQTYSIPISSNDLGIFICARYTGWMPFNGTMDELAVWNRTLSGQEIQQLYSSGAPISCASYWHPADINKDGLVCMPELTNYINRWKLNNQDVTIRELISAIGEWKRAGC